MLLIDAERVFLYAFLPNLAIHLFCDRVLPKNFFIIIEHNLDVIKLADHIIDIGPEGGKHGGEIIATGAALANIGLPIPSLLPESSFLIHVKAVSES